MEIRLDPVFKPHFSYQKGKAPEGLESLAQSIVAADAFVMISPEYNHSMSPALAHLLNHFGSSLFSFKPSAIVTYSAGQWGEAAKKQHALIDPGTVAEVFLSSPSQRNAP